MGYTDKFEIWETISQVEKFVNNRERIIYLILIKRNQNSFFYLSPRRIVYKHSEKKKTKLGIEIFIKTEWKIIKVNSKKSGKKYLMDRTIRKIVKTRK